MTSPAANSESMNHTASKDDDRGSSFKDTFQVFNRFVLLRSLGLALYIFDILTDFNVAYDDYKAGDHLFAYITVGLVFAPGTLFSLYMCCDSYVRYVGEMACLKSPLWIITSPLLPAWVILRDIKKIIEGVIATVLLNKRSKLIEKLTEPSRAYLIKFLEAFTEAAPQLLVRLFRMATRSQRQFSDLRTSEIIQLCFSLFTLSLKLVSTHQKNVSTQQVIEGNAEIDSKHVLPWYLQIIALIWWICFLLSRFQAMALFSASYGYWILLIIGIHVLLIFLFQTIADHKDRLQRIFIYLFGATVFIFAYVQFNLKSRFKIAAWFPYTIFAIVLFVENSIMMTFWYFDQRQGIEKLNAVYNASTSGNLYAGNFPINLNATINTNTNEVEDLQSHWRLLLFLHFGIFGIGLGFMSLLFTCAAICNRNDVTEDKEGQQQFEIQTLMSS